MEKHMCEPCEAGGSYDVNMEPDGIEVSDTDTVTLIWKLSWKSYEKSMEDTETVFVRVDQNKLWWIKGEETGSVDIW